MKQAGSHRQRDCPTSQHQPTPARRPVVPDSFKRMSGVGLGEHSAPRRQGTQAFEQPGVRERDSSWQDRRHNGDGDSAAQGSDNSPVNRGEWGKERNQKCAESCPHCNSGEGEPRVRRPARAAFVERLDLPRPNRPGDTVVGGHNENEPVDIKRGSVTIKLFAGRQPQAQWMLRRARV